MAKLSFEPMSIVLDATGIFIGRVDSPEGIKMMANREFALCASDLNIEMAIRDAADIRG